MILISVKSKYGSCSGNCTGFIKTNYKIKEGSVVGKTGWAVNSVANAVKGSNPFLPKLALIA